MPENYQNIPMRDPKGFLSADDIEKIISASDNFRDKVLFTLLARSGRRVGEIVRCLKPKDIDFVNELVNYSIEKKRKANNKALLPIEHNTLLLLKEYIETKNIKEDELIFKISRQRADKIFKKLCYKVGIERVGNSERNMPHIHMLRHSFAILFAKAARTPNDMIELQHQLAHSRSDTTMFYLNFNPETSREQLNKMWKKD